MALMLALAALIWAQDATVPAVGSAAGIEDEWATSGHANQELAVEESTVEHRAAGTASCARCHASQGFVAWTDQLAEGDPGALVGPDGKAATVEYLASLGLTEAQVKAVDCDACHTGDFGLRITQNTPMLPSGFAASSVGAGALCMTCHNTRNGKIAWDKQDPGRLTAPHHSAQADVIMGQNVYFVDYDAKDMVSPHAAFAGDSCVTCHMNAGGGHTFKASTSCATCHGSGYEASMVQEPMRALFDQTALAIGDRFLRVYGSKMATVGAWDEATDQTQTRPLSGADVRSASLTSIHGQMALELKLKDGSTVSTQIAQVKDAGGKALVPTSDPLVRAGWNYLMLLWDGSYGVHNPTFTRQVLLATQQAMR